MMVRWREQPLGTYRAAANVLRLLENIMRNSLDVVTVVFPEHRTAVRLFEAFGETALQGTQIWEAVKSL